MRTRACGSTVVMAKAKGLVDDVPFARTKHETGKVRLFKENNRRVRYLTDEEEKELRKAIGEDEWPKVAFAFLTGFRQGNQFRLPWTDVNFDAGVVWARNPKGKHDYCVPMNDELRELLAGLPSRLRSKWVFPKRDEHRTHRNTQLHEPILRAGH